MIGNCAGIIGAASFGTPVISVGNRQNLRERNANVIDVEAEAEALDRAVGNMLAKGRFAPATSMVTGMPLSGSSTFCAGCRLMPLFYRRPMHY